MGLFNIFKRKKRRPNYDFDGLDRARSLQTRQLRSKIKDLEHQIQIKALENELADLQEETEDNDISEDNSVENKFFDMVMKLLESKQQQKMTQHLQSNDLTDEQITEYLSKIPPDAMKKIKKFIKKNSDSNVRLFISHYQPQLSKESINKIINRLKDI